MGLYYQTAKSFEAIEPAQLAGAGLVTLDAENVLTLYGNPELAPGVFEKIISIQGLNRIAPGGGGIEGGTPVAIATNNKDRGYIDELASQLPSGVVVFSGLDFANKKTSPAMFLAAAEHFDVDQATAVHVDDQYLSMRGARMAGFYGGVLVKPYGHSDHKGVKAGRPLDLSARLAIGYMRGLEWVYAGQYDD